MTLQHRVQDVLDELVATGGRDRPAGRRPPPGHRVVDVADGTTRRPVTPETLFFSFSTAKGVAALITHLLVRNGLVGYDTPAAEVWPEFGVHGKETETVRHPDRLPLLHLRLPGRRDRVPGHREAGAAAVARLGRRAPQDRR
jgi:hypothetical protein